MLGSYINSGNNDIHEVTVSARYFQNGGYAIFEDKSRSPIRIYRDPATDEISMEIDRSISSENEDIVPYISINGNELANQEDDWILNDSVKTFKIDKRIIGAIRMSDINNMKIGLMKERFDRTVSSDFWAIMYDIQIDHNSISKDFYYDGQNKIIESTSEIDIELSSDMIFDRNGERIKTAVPSVQLRNTTYDIRLNDRLEGKHTQEVGHIIVHNPGKRKNRQSFYSRDISSFSQSINGRLSGRILPYVASNYLVKLNEHTYYDYETEKVKRGFSFHSSPGDLIPFSYRGGYSWDIKMSPTYVWKDITFHRTQNVKYSLLNPWNGLIHLDIRQDVKVNLPAIYQLDINQMFELEDRPELTMKGLIRYSDRKN